MRDDIAHPPKTSVPHWGSTPPALSAAATAYTLFSLDSDRGTARQWAHDLTAAGVDHDLVEVDGTALPDWLPTCDALLEELAAARHVGWRIAAAGDEAGVLAAAAAAHRVGLIDREITIFAESRRRSVVYCAHCKADTLVDVGAGGGAACCGCRRALNVRPHVSRRTGTYLGVAAP
jgi:hypothetical protein